MRLPPGPAVGGILDLNHNNQFTTIPTLVSGYPELSLVRIPSSQFNQNIPTLDIVSVISPH